jgi:hypothetical protein
MMNSRWLLTLVFPCFLHVALSQVAEHDMLPLQINRVWTYQFASEQHSYYQGTLAWIRTRTGILTYLVLDQKTLDTVRIWHVATVESLESHDKYVYPYSPEPRLDTSYSTVVLDTFAVHERLLNNHMLTSDSCNPLWSFPRRWNGTFTNKMGSPVYRYSLSSNTDTVSSSGSDYGYMYFSDTLVVAADIGIIWASSHFFTLNNNSWQYAWNARLLQGPVSVPLEENSRLPQQAKLYPAYPNPFNPMTTISYYIPSSETVSLTIYDILGRTIVSLVSAVVPAGYHSVVWDARGQSSGIYFCCLRTKDHIDIVQLCLVR